MSSDLYVWPGTRARLARYPGTPGPVPEDARPGTRERLARYLSM